MTTVQQAVDICRDRYLLGGMQEQVNQLAANYTAGQTSLLLKYAVKSIQAGARLQIGTEAFFVWAVDGTSLTATVSGARLGSTAQNHSAGDLVTVNPRYFDHQIVAAINEDLSDLSSMGLFQVKQIEFPYNPARIGYDLTGITDFDQVLEVRYETNDQFKGTPRIPGSMYRLERSYLVSENSSTVSLKLFQGGVPGRNITVLYKAPFAPITNLSDDLAAVSGLPASALDLPPLGAALRLGAGREVRRNQTESQGDTLRATEVASGAIAGSFRQIAQLRAARVQAELNAIQARYPAERT
jgi:hypothetical protein